MSADSARLNCSFQMPRLLLYPAVILTDFKRDGDGLAQPGSYRVLSPRVEITAGVLEEPAGWRRACSCQPAAPPTHGLIAPWHEPLLPASIRQGSRPQKMIPPHDVWVSVLMTVSLCPSRDMLLMCLKPTPSFWLKWCSGCPTKSKRLLTPTHEFHLLSLTIPGFTISLRWARIHHHDCLFYLFSLYWQAASMSPSDLYLFILPVPDDSADTVCQETSQEAAAVYLRLKGKVPAAEGPAHSWLPHAQHQEASGGAGHLPASRCRHGHVRLSTPVWHAHQSGECPPGRNLSAFIPSLWSVYSVFRCDNLTWFVADGASEGLRWDCDTEDNQLAEVLHEGWLYVVQVTFSDIWFISTLTNSVLLFLHPAVLYFLLQVSFLVDEGVSPVLLQLLSCALCGSKVVTSSSSSSFSGGSAGSSGQTGASQSSQSKSSSKKSKKEDKEKDKDGSSINHLDIF